MFRSRGIAQFVMAGLVPATHALLGCAKDVGARQKAGHDNREIVRNPTGISSRLFPIPMFEGEIPMLRLKTARVSSMAAILTAAAWSPAGAAVNCADLANLKIPASEIGQPSGGA